MQIFSIPLWKKAPFTRLLLPVICGILIQRFADAKLFDIVVFFVVPAFLLVLLTSGNVNTRFRLRVFTGILLNTLLLATGMMLYLMSNIRLINKWYGNNYLPGKYVIACIDEVPVAKPASYKAEARVLSCSSDSTEAKSTGNIIIYFEKDSLSKPVYGQKILFKKELQLIKNSGNPGSFDYRQYCEFKGIFHQVYLKKGDWQNLPGRENNYLKSFLINSRETILSILRKYIKGQNEIGIAEALLIGYKEDLDKDIVQAYSNTGVVHIIAISGLHLGLIYLMLLWLANRTPYLKKSRWAKLILILSSLWLFALLTGGSASVLRSAVMFSCILTGESLKRKTSIYNSLAASALILLFYDPYILWDVGFQLSYLAVIGIVLLQKPIYDLLFVEYKWLDKVWKLIAVSLAAQVLTTPICIYYFHQFPNYFLLSNLLAVPLSSAILFMEITLLLLSFIPSIAYYIGQLINVAVWLMNEIILRINSLPFAMTKDIYQDFIQTVISYTFTFAVISFWLVRNRVAIIIALAALILLNTSSLLIETNPHSKLVVYNVPKKSAIDIIDNGEHFLIGDSTLKSDEKLSKFTLHPSRMFFNSSTPADTFHGFNLNSFYQVRDKKIFLLKHNISAVSSKEKVKLDVLIISGNPKLSLKYLSDIFDVHTYVFDASNSLWKIGKWKKECELLHLRSFIVPERGAFVLDLKSP